jgi:sucrose-6-phosphate hydrolase SacC (GH32 family)
VRIPALAKVLFACVLALSTLLVSAQTSDYDQPYRPQVHFSPREHWTNDPNGLVYFHGEYHLFYQFNPFGKEWGHMSWGHAVSRDLLHWTELPVAIPEKNGEMAFTGSVVVDHDNTSGFCAPKHDCLVAIYTGYGNTPQGTRQVQNLASSVDDGRTWTRFAGNPVIDLHLADFRDPSVSWDEKQGHWLMAVSLPTEHKVRFYSSPNLKLWTQLSDFGPAGDVGGVWECPDLLRIPAERGKENIWALKIGLNPGAPQGGSGEQYFLGKFDGTRFVASGEPGSHGWTNYGKDDYCASGFNGLPREDKPALIGWMNNWQYATKLPTSPWRGQMSIPRRLAFVRDGAGLAIQQEPVIAPLRAEPSDVSRAPVSIGESMVVQAPFELDLQFETGAEQIFGVRLYTDGQYWTEIGFDRAKGEFYVDRTMSGGNVSPDFPARTLAPLVTSRPFNVKVIVDRSSIEAFAQNGTIAMTNLIFPPSQSSKLVLFPATRKAGSVTGRIWRLRSIWE